MRHTIRKQIAIALIDGMMFVALAGCGTPEPEREPSAGSTSDAASVTAGENETVDVPAEAHAIGTVLLSVNPEIEIDYDEFGRVVELIGRNEEGKQLLASYTGYEGRPCTEVVEELVKESHVLGYFTDTIDGHEKNIVLKLKQGSGSPNDSFLTDLAEAVATAAKEAKIGSKAVVLDQDDYDDVYEDKGYISASAARDILSAQLDREDLAFIDKEYDLDDGDYEIEFVLDGVEYEYEVDAFTGKVKEIGVDQGEDRYGDDDDDWYGDPTGSDYPGDSDDDDDWEDRYDGDDDDWYGDPTGSDYPGDSDDDDWEEEDEDEEDEDEEEEDE